MTYTRNWSSATPLGTTAAKEIDDNIRAQSLDTQERLTSMCATGKTINDDPFCISPERVGNSNPVMTRMIIVPPASVQALKINDGTTNPGGSSFSNGGTAFNLYAGCGVQIPVGYTITAFEAYLDKSGATSVTARLQGWNMTTGVALPDLDTGALTRTASGIGAVTATGLSRVVTNTDTYAVYFTTPSESQTAIVYGARITVEIPNLSYGY